MQSVAESLHAAFAEREWEPEVRQAMDDALDAALAWRDEGMPLREAARFGEIADRTGVRSSAARSQARAAMAASPSDPRKSALLSMLTALIARQPGAVVTTKGWVFSRDELLYRGVAILDSAPPKQADPLSDPWNA